MRHGTLAVSALWFCGAVSGSALADPAGDPIAEAGSQLRIVYEAPDDCPSREVFLQEWRALGEPEGDFGSELGAGVVRVTLRSSGQEYAASVVMVDGAGQCGARRTLFAPSCADLAADVAASLDLAIRDWSCPPPVEKSCPSPASVPECQPLPEVDTSCPNPGPRSGDFGLTEGLLWFVPDQRRGAWGLALVLGYRSARSRGGAAAGPAWSAQLQLGYWLPEVLDAQVPGSELDLQLRLANARIAACPLEFRVVGPLSLPLCGTMEAGVVGVRVEGQRQPDRLWAALGIAPRLRLSSPTLFAEAEPSVGFPIMRYRIQGGREIMNWFAVGAQIRLGVRF